MRTKSGQKGFTLVEVMIVVAIAAILAAVATPAIIATFPRYRLRAEARELVINFKKAKVEAVKRNQNVIIVFTLGAGSGYQMCVDADKNNNCGDPTDIPLLTQQLRTNLQLLNNTFNPAGYNSKGFSLGANGQNINIATADGSRTYNLSVSSNGNARLR